MTADEPGLTKAQAQNELVLAALAAGEPYALAGKAGRMSERTVRRRMNEPEFAAEVARRRRLHVSDMTGMLLASSTQAVLVVKECLNSEKVSDRLRAAELLLNLVRRFHSDPDIEARLTALEADGSEQADPGQEAPAHGER